MSALDEIRVLMQWGLDVEKPSEKPLHLEKEPILIKARHIAGSTFPNIFAAIPLELGTGVELEPVAKKLAIPCFALQHGTPEEKAQWLHY